MYIIKIVFKFCLLTEGEGKGKKLVLRVYISLWCSGKYKNFRPSYYLHTEASSRNSVTIFQTTECSVGSRLVYIDLLSFFFSCRLCYHLTWFLCFLQRKAAYPGWTKCVVYLLTVLPRPRADFWRHRLHSKHRHLVSWLRTGRAAARTAHIPRRQWSGSASGDYQSELFVCCFVFSFKSFCTIHLYY